MKAVLCNTSPIKYVLVRYLSRLSPSVIYGPLCLAKFADIPEPELVNEEWVKIKPIMSGICGSDIGGLNGQESFYLEPYVSKKFVLGHENVGTVAETGKDVKNLKNGDRVVVIPFLSCTQRGIKELCEYCKRGDYSLCENVNEGSLPAGLSIGWNSRTSGGWSEYFTAHYSSVIKLPDEISNEDAVMIDSFSCALHAVMQNPPKENDKILVYGCGTMGLNIVISIRALGFKNEVTAIYSRKFQGDMAIRLGASKIINLREDLFKRIAEITNAKLYFPSIGKPAMEGGVGIVYDCVANPDTINNSLRFLKAKGRLVMIATAGVLKNIDIAPLWFRELKIIGSCEQGHEKYRESIKSTYQAVIEMLQEKIISLKQLVTHKFPLKDFKLALRTAIGKKEPVIKTVLYN